MWLSLAELTLVPFSVHLLHESSRSNHQCKVLVQPLCVCEYARARPDDDGDDDDGDQHKARAFWRGRQRTSTILRLLLLLAPLMLFSLALGGATATNLGSVCVLVCCCCCCFVEDSSWKAGVRLILRVRVALCSQSRVNAKLNSDISLALCVQAQIKRETDVNHFTFLTHSLSLSLFFLATFVILGFAANQPQNTHTHT